jgi:hypothetical protein
LTRCLTTMDPPRDADIKGREGGAAEAPREEDLHREEELLEAEAGALASVGVATPGEALEVADRRPAEAIPVVVLQVPQTREAVAEEGGAQREGAEDQIPEGTRPEASPQQSN